MTDSEVKPSSPTTEAGRALFPGRNLAQKFATVTLAKILAIEQQARDEGRREAVRDVQAYGEVWATKNGRELRIPFDDLLRLAGLNASESPPTDRCDQIVNNGVGEPTECGRTLPCEMHDPESDEAATHLSKYGCNVFHDTRCRWQLGDASESGQPPEASDE